MEIMSRKEVSSRWKVRPHGRKSEVKSKRRIDSEKEDGDDMGICDEPGAIVTERLRYMMGKNKEDSRGGRSAWPS